MPKLSGKNGKVVLGSSDFAGVRGWEATISSNNPQFATSDAAGHKVSVAGVKSMTGTVNIVHERDDPVYDRVKPGDSVTLLLHENADRKWTFPVRIESLGESVDVDDGGEITVSCEVTGNGAWTYPDGTVSS